VQIHKLWILYSEFLIPKDEYVTFQTYFLSLLVKEKMNKILHIILISIFSLILISCAEKDESSSSSSATTLSAPSGLTAAGAASQVTLDWIAVSGASSYTVYWDNSTGVSSSSTAITSVSTDNYTHSSLDNGTTYYYKVAAVDSAGTGTLSSEVNAATPLPAPDNLSASGANNTITLIWNSVSGATSYTLYWDNVSGIDSSDTAITSITNDNYTHNNMDNGSTYYYKVAAVNSSGTGTLSSVASALLSADIQGSQTYNAHTYAITSSAMNHADATAAAASAGGYLVTITTKAENDWLTATFETIYGDIWIGAKDVISEGTWVWDSGTGENFSSSSVWPSDNTTRKFCSNEPNNSGDCAQIYQASGCWDDTTCSSTKLGIIEFD
jgi:fibronectin type 3 domain-containing protein